MLLQMCLGLLPDCSVATTSSRHGLIQITTQPTDHPANACVALLTGRAKDGSVTHGSHTASTAAGNHGIVSDNPLYRGTMSGMAPAARLAIYKVR
jgi:hypothetical protein